MTSVRVIHHLGDLADDLKDIAKQAPKDMDRLTGLNAKRGNRIAKDYARVSAAEHGKHYHKAFTVERIALHRWEYGPDSAMPQGGMSFEGGSRNQPAHNDLAKSSDVVGVLFARDVARLPSKWFWP